MNNKYFHEYIIIRFNPPAERRKTNNESTAAVDNRMKIKIVAAVKVFPYVYACIHIYIYIMVPTSSCDYFVSVQISLRGK